MGIQVKKDKEPLVMIPYFMLQSIGVLIGKFKCSTYEDFEFIQKKKESLNDQLKAFSEKVQQEPDKAQQVWQGESELSKSDFAWLPKEALKALVPEMKLSADEIDVLQFWVVKD